MHCSMSNSYLGRATGNAGVTKLEEEVLKDIEDAFGTIPFYGIPTEDISSLRYNVEFHNPSFLLVRNPIKKSARFLDAHRRIFILNDIEWRSNQRLTMHPLARGNTVYSIGAILLHENGDNKCSWCRKTLIHEILHSTSIYSRIWFRHPSIMRLRRFFREGITECLTGYILYKNHPKCYDGWKSDKLSRCSISYKNNVRLWCSLCQCIGIKNLAKFYLSTIYDPVKAWNSLVQSVRTAGFLRFNYKLIPSQAYRENEFRQLCIDSFPRFKEIYDSMTRSIDFSQIQ